MNRSLETLFPLTQYRCASAIELNGIWYSAAEISNSAGKFADPVLVQAADPPVDFSLKGSAAFISFLGRHFAILTKHQYQGCDASELAFKVWDANTVVVGGTHYVPEGGNDYGDELCYIDLAQTVEEGLIPRSRFLDISKTNYCLDGDDIVGGMSYGFAFVDQNFEVDETGEHDFRLTHYTSRRREVLCSYHGDGFDSQLSKWLSVSGQKYDLDGFSGGPVFAIVKETNGLRCKFAGINMSSNGTAINAVKVDTVRRYLNSICS